MPANLSLILNVLLLIGVVVSIGRLLKARRHARNIVQPSPNLDKNEPKICDDIIAVRKISPDLPPELELDDSPLTPKREEPRARADTTVATGQSLMIFLLAKENRTLAGYELLQTVLAAGLRFGEGHLFHRHQYTNGQGPVLCSLAAATATGVFDLQNIGAFSVRGLCLFMTASGNVGIDTERLSVLLDTARQLADDLDTHLLDEAQRPFTDATVARFCQRLNIKNTKLFMEPA